MTQLEVRRGRSPLQSATTYAAVLAYRGSDFWGFARQPGVDTVESALREVLERLVPSYRGLVVAGRTDRGVSATGQVISFKSEPLDVRHCRQAFNSIRPDALCCLAVREVPRRFHARSTAWGRRYVYLFPDPERRIDVCRLDRLLLPLQGRHCFSAFARRVPAHETVRTLFEARARREGEAVRFDFAAQSFVRRQVRVMVATALREVQRGAPDDSLATLIDGQDRRLTAEPADAAGLYLSKVLY